MKVLAAALCLSLLVALTFAQTSQTNDLVATCSQFCNQTCDFAKQVASLFAIFLGPFIDTADTMCRQTCGFVCGFLG
ncbi:hypothetical protein RRG08_017972 [Elysia crispata]|uniref:Uncharacterized protein n=1 Tax=Elysia crispata TaxID=231223 RepID=A0AAE1DF32_9GAST|nr:hypothetical protein RRG08_017972 [Elysia crispata]